MEANERLTSSTAVVLLVLLFLEGLTVVSVRSLLGPHVFIGVLLVPPVALKIASTGYRFARYYLGASAYRRKGPPTWLLRMLGPAVVVLTVALLGSGVALMLVGPSWHDRLLALHKASFVLWFLAMTVHVLGHLAGTARLGLPDWASRGRRRPAGASGRVALLVATLMAGAAGGVVLLGRVTPYLDSLPLKHLGR
ncbi:MAG TPA: hypothetical protein VE990_11050 [Acidimicrobiales bacterium]|nr:hypothetical protein [Acidimicrobiales bacterium]